MSNYLETQYLINEYSPDAYPQKLCMHLISNYLSETSDILGKSILDIGSGKGNHLLGFERAGMKAFGLDKRKECIDILKNFDIRECDIEFQKFPYEDDFFDFVYSKSVLEHVENADNFLEETLRVLKPGGYALLMCPDWKSQQSHFWDDYTHVKAWTRKGLQDALSMKNFEDVSCEYFFQLPVLWKYPSLTLLTEFSRLLPDSFKWKDKEEKDFRPFIRFSKEKMLLAFARKKL